MFRLISRAILHTLRVDDSQFKDIKVSLMTSTHPQFNTNTRQVVRFTKHDDLPPRQLKARRFENCL